MAKFCGKCGAELDKDAGLCPVCDKEQLDRVKSMSKFCTVCGCQMDQQTGMCPNCTKAAVSASEEEQAENMPFSEDTPLSDTPSTAPKKEKSSALTVVLTVLICFFLFLTTTLGTMIIVVRRSTTEDGAQDILEDIKIVDTINRLNEMSAGNQKGTESKDKQTANKKFIDILNTYLHKKAGITFTERELEELIEDSTVKEFLAEKIALYCEDLYTGDDRFSLREKDVLELFRDNERVIRKQFHASVPDEIFEDLANWMVDDEAIEQMSVRSLKEGLPIAYYTLHVGLSYFTLAFLLLLVLLCVFAMIKNNPTQAVYGIGITFTVAGALFSIVALIALWLPSLWESICAGSLIGTVIGSALYTNIEVYIIMFAIGVLTLLVRAGILLKRKGALAN